ncbi:MAG: SufS family cysteine desulfurase [Simkaniaceae bacterium]|nr:SufS family cysteine desulfurase [Simkaniaceae bacterium]MCF7852398.1 SufS family cysteine desulfurase [Simkaniaceae bacterium]
MASTPTLLDDKTVKADFPLFQSGICYLDSAATTQKPACVIDAMTHFMEHDYATVNRAVYDLAMESTARYFLVREKVARWIHAKRPEEIVWTRGTTDGMNLLAISLARTALQAGDVILISELEHHSNIVPWQLIAKDKKIEVKAIRLKTNGELDLDHMRALLAEGNVKVMSIAHVSNLLGTIHPIREMIREAKKYRVITIVDGAQAPSHCLVDVQALDCDFYLFSGHKIYGPTGIGVLYGKYEWLEALSPCQGGGDMIELVTLEKTTFQKPPLKFEAGTPPITEIIGLGAAIDWIEKIGINKIQAHEKALYDIAFQKLSDQIGVNIIGNPPHRSAIIPFVIEGVHPLDLATMLGAQGICIRSGHMCAQPALQKLGISSICRVSFAYYNSAEDVERFMQALHKLCHILKNQSAL